MKLASLDHDVKDIEIIVFESPTLVVNVAASDGSKPNGASVTAIYAEMELSEDDKLFQAHGPRSDVRFSAADGRPVLLARLLPDAMVRVTASADGCQPQTVSLKLPEGSIRELELVLDKP